MNENTWKYITIAVGLHNDDEIIAAKCDNPQLARKALVYLQKQHANELARKRAEASTCRNCKHICLPQSFGQNVTCGIRTHGGKDGKLWHYVVQMSNTCEKFERKED